MKHFLLISALIIAANCLASNPEKEYRKIAEKYDVPVEVRGLENPAPETYWATMLKNNDALRKFEKDMKKNRGAETEALNQYKGMPKFYPRYSTLVDRSMQPYCDSLLREMGVTAISPECMMCVVYDPKPAAFNVPMENGFAICLSSGLLNSPGLNRDMLMGIVAYCYSHGALRHEMRNIYKSAKDKRRNRIAKGVLIAVAVAGYMTEDYYDNNPWGYTDNSINVQNNSVTIINPPAQNDGPMLYASVFTPEQIYEADMAAFRFMEDFGKGNSYLEVLRLLGADNDSAYAGYPEHPTTPRRIALLEYLRDNPEITNTENIKIRIKGY